MYIRTYIRSGGSDILMHAPPPVVTVNMRADASGYSRVLFIVVFLRGATKHAWNAINSTCNQAMRVARINSFCSLAGEIDDDFHRGQIFRTTSDTRSHNYWKSVTSGPKSISLSHWFNPKHLSTKRCVMADYYLLPSAAATMRHTSDNAHCFQVNETHSFFPLSRRRCIWSRIFTGLLYLSVSFKTPRRSAIFKQRN